MAFWENMDEEQRKSNPQERKIAIIILVAGLILIILSSFIEPLFSFDKKEKNNNIDMQNEIHEQVLEMEGA